MDRLSKERTLPAVDDLPEDAKELDAMPELSGKQRRFLRGLGHHLEPVLTLGKEGIGPSLLAAAEEALLAHELIKARVLEGCPLERREAFSVLAERTGAELVQVLGRTALLYRPSPEPVIELP